MKERKRRRCLRLSRWLGVHWSCRCRYHNNGTDRCFCCGARPPARVRDAVERAA